MVNNHIRNIGIIAHVDHGKTTIVDKLLNQAGLFRSNQVVEERMMDSMDLEKEKGITIRSKNAAIQWNDVKINIVDTPGHADFGGEVERILKMVEGVLLLVDSVDGPQAQTRFVLRKTIENNLKIIVVINKIDRENANPQKIHDQVLELFMELNATDEQFNSPFLYASAKEGYAVKEPQDTGTDMNPLLETIVDYIPAPIGDANESFKMLISNLDWNDYVGRIAIGKILNGSIQGGNTIYRIAKEGLEERKTVSKIFTFDGLHSAESDGVMAGDIVGIAGFEEVRIGETLSNEEDRIPIPFVDLDPPTIRMQISVNDGPLAGRDGKFLTARQIYDRLVRETRTNISLELSESSIANSFVISARGILQVSILVETMRREGFEIMVSKPEVIFQQDESGKQVEPFETLWLEVPETSLGDVLPNLALRKARIEKMEHHHNFVTIEAIISTRGLIGLETYLANKTSGRAVFSHLFKEYGKLCGEIKSRTNGVLISMGNGMATTYSLVSLQERGRLFIGAQENVYEGMVVGENSRQDDLPVNPTKMKQLTNFRCQGEGKSVQLEPPVNMSLEKALEYIAADEFVEITPNNLRLRKKILDANQRKRAA